MCVIIHQPAGKHLTKHDAKALWRQNPDGGGIAYLHGKRVIVVKSLDFGQWWHAYRGVIRKHPNVDVMLHMRIATHGPVSLDNCHPFAIDDMTVMAHNGIIWDCLPLRHDARSDTRVFVEDALPNLPPGWLDNYYLTGMVEAYVEGSKLMFMTADPGLERSVYRLGTWEPYKGLWLTNLYGLVPATPTSTPGPKASVIGSSGSGGNTYKWGSKWDPATVRADDLDRLYDDWQASGHLDVDDDDDDDAAALVEYWSDYWASHD